jgi:predicted TIM-barrel fold metal-dependent hydrolase
MTGLGLEQISKYLSILRALKPSCLFYDTHVHPYEILLDKFSYAHTSSPGVLTLSDTPYRAPSLSPFNFPATAVLDTDSGNEQRSPRLREISQMLLRKVYGNVGERVLGDEMNLSAIDQVLLLPVAPDSGPVSRFDNRMRWVQETYGNRDKFWIAGSIPPGLSCEEIAPYTRSLKQRFGIKAMKCHPVASGIDLGTGMRRQWLEAMLVACGDRELPLVLHGGRYNPYWGGSRGDFGSIEHLKDIDFSLSREAVVLAHAGFHRLSPREIEQEGVPVLRKMLAAHPNLHVDISGLDFEPLKLVLKSVEQNRILFGSDTLYYRQWETVTMAMHALKELGMELEQGFVQIASINPKRVIFKRGKPC